MERQQIHVKPKTAARVGESAKQLGVALADANRQVVEQSYERRYKQGISDFWRAQIYISKETGYELAALKLEAQRQFVIKVARVAVLLGIPCGAVSWWAWGAVVSVIFLFGSLSLGVFLAWKGT